MAKKDGKKKGEKADAAKAKGGKSADGGKLSGKEYAREMK